MMTFLLVIHSITCVLLVLTILMQSGRGGGLTEQFASAESVFGAQTNSFMVRATSVLATVFFVTSLVLALMSAGQERSLMANKAVTSKVQKSAAMKTPQEPVKEAAKTAAQVNAAVAESVPVTSMPETKPAVDTQLPVVTNSQQ